MEAEHDFLDTGAGKGRQDGVQRGTRKFGDGLFYYFDIYLKTHQVVYFKFVLSCILCP